MIAADPEADDQAVVDLLRSFGHHELEAEVLATFLPLALARALISRLPGNVSNKLSEHAIILDASRRMKLPLMQVPEFVEALRLGEETYTTGVIPGEVFSSVAIRSAEFKVINDVLNAGGTVGEISPPVLIRLADAPGFADWYSAVAFSTLD